MARPSYLALLLFFVAAAVARADELFQIERRYEDARAGIAPAKKAPHASKADLARREALDLVLDRYARELDGYATTAPVASALLARERSLGARLEALGLALGVAAPDSSSVGRARAIEAEIAARGPEAEARAFAVRLEDARHRGSLVALLDERLRAPACEAVAKLVKAHEGRVLVLVVDDRQGTMARDEDRVERAALEKDLAPRGLSVVVSSEGAGVLGARAGLELVIDRKGRVRGVDLVGEERRALALALMSESRERP